MAQTIKQLKERAGSFSWGHSVELDDIRGEVAIVGIGETEYSGPSGRSAKAMALEAVAAAIADAGLKPDDVDGLMISPGIGDQITPDDFRAHFNTTGDIWFSQEGGAMIWGATCAHTAAHAIRNRQASTIVNVFSVDWATTRTQGGKRPGDWHASEPMKAGFELPFGWFPQPLYFSTFMHRHMHEFGTTAEQLAQIPLTFRRHANSHKGAVMHDREMSLEQYLARPLLADPFRVEDCCLISDGAGAFVLCAAERAADFPHTPAIVEGVGRGCIDGAPYISQQKNLTATPQTFAAPWAYAMADISAKDIDVIGVYDCFSGTALMQVEDMGFCQKGEGGEFIADDRLYYRRPRSQGGIPCNTHGGLLSHAYVLGIAHVIELVRQIRGTAQNQVEQVRRAAYAGFTADEGATLILARGE
ncbi:acetyl-CoA acetyltransferase [Litorivivens lipolytica]|uniref:Acetyl-CoA acetyltransferase n=1 Tax=Litorivivens lipolytica TaxID=1524264 RepID=A0A7W4W3T4_9GAMM|nr:thiolase family protein [Litorivivens lipolytica]MBB3046931.1 acetyl-CoA acetyltransferase [Litorivivens lipolytica]